MLALWTYVKVYANALWLCKPQTVLGAEVEEMTLPLKESIKIREMELFLVWETYEIQMTLASKTL